MADLTEEHEQLRQGYVSLHDELTTQRDKLEKQYQRDLLNTLTVVWKEKASFLESLTRDSGDSRLMSYMEFLLSELKDLESVTRDEFEEDELRRNSIRRTSLHSGSLTRAASLPARASGLDFSRLGRRSESSLSSSAVYQEKGSVPATAVGFDVPRTSGAVASRILAGAIGKVYVWDTERSLNSASSSSWLLGESSHSVRNLECVSENTILATCGNDAYLLDLREPKPVSVFQAGSQIYSVAAMSTSEVGVACTNNLLLFDIRSNHTLAKIPSDTHFLALSTLSTQTTGGFQGIMAGGRDKMVRVWDDGWRTFTPPLYSAVMSLASLSDDNSHIVAAVSREGQVRLWSLTSELKVTSTLPPAALDSGVACIGAWRGGLIVARRTGEIRHYEADVPGAELRQTRTLAKVPGVEHPTQMALSRNAALVLTHDQ